MKKILTFILAMMLVVGMPLISTAAPALPYSPEVNEWGIPDVKDKISVANNEVHELILGYSGATQKVTRVQAPDFVQDIDIKNDSATGQSHVRFSVKDVPFTKETEHLMRIWVKDGKKQYRVMVTLVTNPTYVIANDWEYIDNGYAYQTSQSEKTNFEFEYGDIVLDNAGETVNFTNNTKITQELYNTYGEDFAGYVDFVADQKFKKISQIRFLSKIEDKPVYVYEITENGLVAITDMKDGFYVKNILTPTTYVLLYNEYVTEEIEPEPEVGPEPEPESEVEVEPDSVPLALEPIENVNDNPGMGR